MTEADDDEVVTVGAPLPAIAAVTALEDHNVHVTWADGRQTVVDLAPKIYAYKVFAPLRDDRALAKSVHVVNPSVIAWGDDDSIDMHALEIEALAAETMAGRDFQDFLREMKLTWDGAAALLGISRRTVGTYVKARSVPRHIVLACAYLSAQHKAEASDN